jgi:uncharacterized protein YjbI with pentapeptide repeats
MKLLCTTVFTLAITTTSFADIFQYSDCDGDGTLLLTEQNAAPGVDLSGLYLGCADLDGATLHGANLTYADLNYANLHGANLIIAYLNGANLNGANLIGANLHGADLTDADLIVADLTNANLNNADLYNANLTGAYLNDADLTGANLIGADLTGADLTGANLTGANLTGANLSGANLTGANLTGTIWVGDVAIEGACCVTSGCYQSTEVACNGFGGTWTGAGSCDDCAPTCAGDINADGVVNIDDLLLLISYFGNTCM